jgi:outer membrane protein
MGCMVVALLAGMAPEVGAIEIMNVGYLDQNVIENTPAFRAASQQLQNYKIVLDQQFTNAMHGINDHAQQQQISAHFNQLFAQRQDTLLAPLFVRGRAAIAEIATRHHLSVVLDHRVVLVGGVDITNDVIQRLASTKPLSSAAPSLPASTIGFVDERQLNSVPSIKAQNDQFAQAQHAIEQQATQSMRSAKNDTDRAAIAQRAQSDQAAKQHAIIDPMVAQLDAAMSKIADQRGLALVVDKGAVIIGGRDVTKDVIGVLK